MFFGSQRRWYETNPLVTEAMLLWGGFPYSIQRVIAQEILHLVQTHEVGIQKTGLLEVMLRLTPKSLKAFYRSLRKQRWYDQDPLLSGAFSAFSTIIHADRVVIAEKIMQMSAYLENHRISEGKAPQEQYKQIAAEIIGDLRSKITYL